MEDETKDVEYQPETGEESVVNTDLSMSDGGSSPPVKVRLSVAIVMQIITVVIAATVAVVGVQAKVDHIIQDHDRELVTNSEILKRVTELDAKVDYLTREIWYIRAKTDRMTEKKGE